MALFQLRIIASDRTFFDGEVFTVIFPAPDGEFQIMAHHESMVVAVSEGGFRYKTAEDEPWMHGVCGIGFVNIEKDQVTMLVDTAEKPEEIDTLRAKRAMDRAREKMQQKQSLEEYHASTASLSRAMARLKEAGKINIADD